MEGWTLQVLALDVRLQGAYSGLTPANLSLHLSRTRGSEIWLQVAGKAARKPRLRWQPGAFQESGALRWGIDREALREAAPAAFPLPSPLRILEGQE